MDDSLAARVLPRPLEGFLQFTALRRVLSSQASLSETNPGSFAGCFNPTAAASPNNSTRQQQGRKQHSSQLLMTGRLPICTSNQGLCNPKSS